MPVYNAILYSVLVIVSMTWRTDIIILAGSSILITEMIFNDSII